MTSVNRIVFIHGWGLNSLVWGAFADKLREIRPDIEIQCVDLPGYGRFANEISPNNLPDLASHCLREAPEPALWVGWSLGGMVAMQAALSDQAEQVQGLQLINSSAKFVASPDWEEGVDLAIFERFSNELAADYQRTLMMFLLLQAGSNAGARELARSAHQAISRHPSPSSATLDAGIACLETADLRAHLNDLRQPIQIINGLRDRVAKPENARRLAQMLSADLVELDTGHAPFMTMPDEMIAHLTEFADGIY